MSRRFSYDPDARLLTVGDRRFPAVCVDSPFGDGDHLWGNGYAFRSRRVRVSMENGYQLSIVWGTGTYSDNWDALRADAFVEEPERVEVAVFAPGGNPKRMLDLGSPGCDDVDAVAPHCTAVDVQRLIVVVSALSTSEPPDVVEFERDGGDT